MEYRYSYPHKYKRHTFKKMRLFLIVVYVLFFSSRKYRHETLVVTTFLEFNNTINESIQSMILTHSNVLSRIVNSTALTDDDITSDTFLTAKNLNA